jgi:hypothetical protein
LSINKANLFGKEVKREEFSKITAGIPCIEIEILWTSFFWQLARTLGVP